MDRKIEKWFHSILLVLAVMLAVCMAVQMVIVSKYNRTLHQVEGPDSEQPTYMDIHFRGGDTASWIKREAGLYGNIYDAALYNDASNPVSTWTLRIDILGDCYLNQFWNGTTEIHQHAGTDKEVSQTLNLAQYDTSLINLEYTMDASDLLIPLSKGDYIIYHPSEALGEMPIGAGKELVVGMIFYTKEESADVSSYQLEYYYKMSVTQGPLFISFIVLCLLWVLVLGIYVSARLAYKEAQKEMNLRKSGISCMAELYESIYIIDLKSDSIIPVSVGEKDRERPKDDPPNEQLKNLFDHDAEEGYQAVMRDFADLDTLGNRMQDRSSIAVEYKSKGLDWCRVRFIAMDRAEGAPLTKVLLTIQQINQEKRELDAIREQMEEEKIRSSERRDYLESIFLEARTPIRSVLALNERIYDESMEVKIRGYAEEIRTTSQAYLAMIDRTLDYSRLESGKMKLSLRKYNLKEMLSDVEHTAQIGIPDKRVEFLTESSKYLPDTLIGDEQKLRQVILSLLSRAIGEIRSGTIRLRTFASKVDDKTVHLLFSVQVTGDTTEAEDSELGMRLISGLMGLLGCKLRVATLGESKDVYFELDQEIAEEKSAVQAVSAEAKS